MTPDVIIMNENIIVKPYFYNIPVYMQKIFTHGKGVMIPIQKLSISVMDVMVMDTAASVNASDIRSGTELCTDVRRHAPNITKVSSMPIPKNI